MMFFVPNTSIQRELGRHYLPRPDYEFLKSLSTDGHEITVIGFVADKNDPFSDYPIDEIERLKIFNLGYHSRYSGKLRKLTFYFRAIFKCATLLIRNNDFVYLYFPGHMTKLIGLFYVLTGRNYGMYVRGVWGRSGMNGKVSDILFRHASFVLTTGLGFKQIIEKLNPNTEPVYPMTTFTPDHVDVANRSYESFRHLLFVGHIRERKGVLDSISAVALAREAGIVLMLHIIGGGDEIDISNIKSITTELRLDGQVEYHGHVSDADQLVKYFEVADAFLYPSYYPEGFPRVVYEAMIFGLPVICTILPGMRGFMEADNNCIEVDAESPEQICNALIKLKTDCSLRERIGASARRSVSDYFSQFDVKGHANQFLQRSREIGIYEDLHKIK